MGVLWSYHIYTLQCLLFPVLMRILSITALAVAGQTVLMMYAEHIHGSFYDLFNRFYMMRYDREGNVDHYVNVAIGPHCRMCRVHPNAKIIVHVTGQQIRQLPMPFLNRFEK